MNAKSRTKAHWFWVIGLSAGLLICAAFTLITLYILATRRPFRGRDILAPVFLARMTWVCWRTLQRRLKPEHPLANLFTNQARPPDFPRFP